MQFLSLGKYFAVLKKHYVALVLERLPDIPVSKHYIPFFIISQNNGTINQQQLANQLFLDKVSMARIIDCLCSIAVIERIVNPNDRREHLLRITDEGQQYIPIIHQAILETNDLFLSFIPADEKESFMRNLKTITSSIIELPVRNADNFNCPD